MHIQSTKPTKFVVDVVIIGGGPCTLGLLSNAVKSNRLNELVNSGDGIAILEQGLAFGGGALQNFGINSNTSANGFIKCLYKKVVPPNSQTSQNKTPQQSNIQKFKHMKVDLEDETSDEDSDESKQAAEWIALPPFKDLYKSSPLIQMSFEFGPSIIPLSAVGMIFNFTGNHLLHYIHTVMRRKVFYPCHTVTSVQLLPSGEIVTTATRKEVQIKLLDEGSKFEIVTIGETQVTFRSKAVIISHGGRQELHQDFYKWFPSLLARPDRVMLSDHFLKRQGFQNIVNTIQEKKIRKIVIIGGSHSGFSAAWMLLHGPADLLHNTSVRPTCQIDVQDRNKSFKFPEAVLKQIKDCIQCCTCINKQKGCGCVCKCYGFFKYEQTNFDYNTMPVFEECDIKILYRDQIRVFYSRVQYAQQDGYTDYKSTVFSNKNGFLYSFTGLRGDARNLYKQIKSGKEKRVQLIKCPTVQDQQQYVDEADLVIWSTGYQTQHIQIKDENKIVQLQSKIPFTQFDVDNKCRLVTSDSNLLTKTFGSGLAFPMRSNDGMIIPDSGKLNPRADSFSLYLNFVANQMLQNILPKIKIESKLQKLTRGNKQEQSKNGTSSFATPIKTVFNKVLQINSQAVKAKKIVGPLSSAGMSQYTTPQRPGTEKSQLRCQSSNNTAQRRTTSISNVKTQAAYESPAPVKKKLETKPIQKQPFQQLPTSQNSMYSLKKSSENIGLTSLNSAKRKVLTQAGKGLSISGSDTEKTQQVSTAATQKTNATEKVVRKEYSPASETHFNQYKNGSVPISIINTQNINANEEKHRESPQKLNPLQASGQKQIFSGSTMPMFLVPQQQHSGGNSSFYQTPAKSSHNSAASPVKQKLMSSSKATSEESPLENHQIVSPNFTTNKQFSSSLKEDSTRKVPLKVFELPLYAPSPLPKKTLSGKMSFLKTTPAQSQASDVGYKFLTPGKLFSQKQVNDQLQQQAPAMFAAISTQQSVIKRKVEKQSQEGLQKI